MNIQLNGQAVYAYSGGKKFDPALPCIVFIHGAMNDHSVWTLLARWFAHHGWAVLAVDLPGHGRSVSLPLDSVEDLGAWIWQLLDAAGVQQAALVGHSMGSLIALEAAAQAPERASHLLLLATASPMKVSPALLDLARTQPLQAIKMVNGFSFASWAGKPSYPGPGAWMQGGEIALKCRMQKLQTGVNLFEHDFRICDAYAGGMSAAARVKCKSRLILGALDQMTAPKQARALAEALQCRSVTLDCGHSLMAERPDQLLLAIRQALEV